MSERFGSYTPSQNTRKPGAQPRRTPSGGGARRPQKGGKRPTSRGPRRRANVKLIAIAAAAVVAIVLIVVAGVKISDSVRDSKVERFVPNVYINGVDMNGYTKEEGYNLINELRDNWINATYQLTYDGRTWDFSPAYIDAELDFTTQLDHAWNLGHMGDRATRKEIVRQLEAAPAQFTAELTYDEAALDAFIDGVASEVHREPVEAEVTLTELKPVITRMSENGADLDREKLKENLVCLIETGTADLALPVNEVQPVLMSDNMDMTMIAKVETDVTFRGYPSRTNVRLALEHFNLMAVYPGETISFNDVVGPRTEALGYQRAPEYAGNRKEMGTGGGVCQASTTLYNAVMQAGMTVVTRFRHAMTVVYVNPSQDAAVEYPDKDFVFRNDTAHPIFIYTDVSKERAQVIIYGTRPEYHYELEGVVVREEPSELIGYEDDESGKHVYYTTDQPVLYKEGRGSCESQGWLVSYDWETKQEVGRVQVSADMYSPGVNVYWRGVHEPNDGGKDTSGAENLAALQ